MPRSREFLQLLRHALRHVDERYFLHPRAYVDALIVDGLPPKHPRHQRVRDALLGFSERVFCYELYHQMRKRMDELPRGTFGEALLQCELRKQTISDVVERKYAVRKLTREYMPDFLLHSPGNFDHQHIVMEVKADPKLRLAPLKHDLLKLQEFITRYNYRAGVFLTVNTNHEAMLRRLRRMNGWIEASLPDRPRIHFVCAANPADDPCVWTLDAIP